VATDSDEDALWDRKKKGERVLLLRGAAEKERGGGKEGTFM